MSRVSELFMIEIRFFFKVILYSYLSTYHIWFKEIKLILRDILFYITNTVKMLHRKVKVIS